jgi:hypothetical protein
MKHSKILNATKTPRHEEKFSHRLPKLTLIPAYGGTSFFPRGQVGRWSLVVGWRNRRGAARRNNPEQVKERQGQFKTTIRDCPYFLC